MTVSAITKWGNSQGIRIPKSVMLAAHLCENDEVELIADKETILLRKLRRPQTLDELFAGYEGDYQPVEIDTARMLGWRYWTDEHIPTEARRHCRHEFQSAGRA